MVSFYIFIDGCTQCLRIFLLHRFCLLFSLLRTAFQRIISTTFVNNSIQSDKIRLVQYLVVDVPWRVCIYTSVCLCMCVCVCVLIMVSHIHNWQPPRVFNHFSIEMVAFLSHDFDYACVTAIELNVSLAVRIRFNYVTSLLCVTPIGPPMLMRLVSWKCLKQRNKFKQALRKPRFIKQ